MSTPDYSRTEALLRAALTAEVDTTMTLTDTPREYERLTGRIRRSRRRTQLLAAAAVLAVIAAGTGLAVALRDGDRSRDLGPADPRPSSPSLQQPRTTPLTPQALPDGSLLGTVAGVPSGTIFVAPWGPDAVAWGEDGRELVVLDGESGRVVGRQGFAAPADATIRSAVSIPTGMIVTFQRRDVDPSERLVHIFVDGSFRERGRVVGGWTGAGLVAGVTSGGEIWIATGLKELSRVDDTGRAAEKVTLAVTGASFVPAAEGFWLTDFHANTTTLVDRDGALVTTLTTVEPVSATLAGGRLIVFTGRGDTYVIDRTERRTVDVVRGGVGPVGGWLAQSAGSSTAYGTAGGRLFVIDATDPTASRSYLMAGSEFATVAHSDGGRLWVLHDNGRLERYDPAKL